MIRPDLEMVLHGKLQYTLDREGRQREVVMFGYESEEGEGKPEEQQGGKEIGTGLGRTIDE
jgi:hypothetical protein